MANISIISECNRTCSYCFAQTVNIKNKPELMSLETFKDCIKFIDRSGIEQIRILGGEPTLHPQFENFIRLSLQKQKPIIVFSNGIVNENTLHFLNEIRNENISFIVNVTDIELISELIRNKIFSLFTLLGNKIMLGINIYKMNTSLEFLKDYIIQFGLNKHIRVGIAHPCVGHKNIYLYPRLYNTIGNTIFEFAKAVSKDDIKINFDCGFVPCMFPQGAMEFFGKSALQIGKLCSPIPDILPDGRIISCYPLAKVCSEKIDNEITALQINKKLETKLKKIGNVSIFRECSVCFLYKNGKCSGGCLSSAQKRLSRFIN